MRVLVYDQNTRGHNPSWLYCVGMACLQAGHDLVLASTACPEVDEWVDRICDEFKKIDLHGMKPMASDIARAVHLAVSEKCEMLVFPYLDGPLMELAVTPKVLDGLSLKLGGIFFRPRADEKLPYARLRLALLKLVRTRHAKNIRRELRTLMRHYNGNRALERHVKDGGEINILSLNSDEHHDLLKQIYPYARIGRLTSDPSLSKSELTIAQARRKHSLPENKYIYMHCGLDGPEKGLESSFMAWRNMPEAVRDQTLFLRAGHVSDGRLAQDIQHNGILMNYYIPQEKLDDLYAACDCVLIPYREHTGTSGVLVNAAAAGRPVIAPRYAVIGELVESHELGYLYRHLDDEDLCRVMQLATQEGYAQSAHSREYVKKNSAAAFVDEIRRFFFK